MDPLHVWNLTSNNQRFMAQSDKQPIGPMELLIGERGEKKELGLPNEICWEHDKAM
jgi:hypothetical protein